MTESEYSNAIKISLRVDARLPGQCGECAAIEMELCTECCEKIGIVNKPEYHETIYSHNKIRSDINNNKKRILWLFSKREDKKDDNKI